MKMMQPDWEQLRASEGFHMSIIGSYTHLLSISLLLWASCAHWSLPTLKSAVQAVQAVFDGECFHHVLILVWLKKKKKKTA